jgi:hypothetical protein
MITAYADIMIAHQGGWDEFLYAAIPIGLIFALLRLANSRAKKLTRPDATNQPESD